MNLITDILTVIYRYHFLKICLWHKYNTNHPVHSRIFFDIVKLKYKYTEKAIFMNIAKNIINKRYEEDIKENPDREGNKPASR